MNNLFNKESIVKLNNSIIKYFGIPHNNTIKELDKILSNDYKNIIVLIYDHINNKDDILCKIRNKNTINNNSIIKEINDNTNYTAYGLFPFGKAKYEDINHLYKQIINISKIDNKKLIYAYIEDDYNNINILLDSLKDDIVIITSLKDTYIPIITYSKENNDKEGIIRKVEFKDYNKVKVLTNELKDLLYKKRRDIFLNVVMYTQQEFYQVCEEYNDTLCLIYEKDNEILGLIEVQIINAGENRRLRQRSNLIINKLIVKEEYRRKGIGTKLYNEILTFSKKRKVDYINIKSYYFTKEMTKFIENLDIKPLEVNYVLNISNTYKN
ncbi:MAG: GNAT family N-acetyltransferase [Bacilli bacterium]|nr:GNAT family N-acetyltransferase [Bacilli bacterium]